MTSSSRQTVSSPPEDRPPPSCLCDALTRLVALHSVRCPSSFGKGLSWLTSMDRFVEFLHSDRGFSLRHVRVVRFEDLVDQGAAVCKRILHFVGKDPISGRWHSPLWNASQVTKVLSFVTQFSSHPPPPPAHRQICDSLFPLPASSSSSLFSDSAACRGGDSPRLSVTTNAEQILTSSRQLPTGT
jgi:hypothetical protein